MEALCATFVAGSHSWFCKPACARDDRDSESDDDDNNQESDRAQAACQAAACIAACVRWLDLAVGKPPPHADETIRNCNALWRAKFKSWQEPCGNHLNVPDLLFVAACHLRVASMSVTERKFPHAVDAVVQLRADIEHALREWNRVPSALHTEYRTTINVCARAIVMWGSIMKPERLLDTTLSPEDVSMLTMNVNVHQNLDNRARNTDLTSAVNTDACIAAAPPQVDQEEVLQNFVSLASRYAFFALLHAAARRAASEPQTELHRRLVTDAVRPSPELVGANVAKFDAVFRDCSRVSMPDLIHREINYMIWKWMLSVGAMEAYLRMAPTIEWHKLNPVTVSIREPTAATMPGALVRAVAISDYDGADPEWPEHVRLCHREVWRLMLWHQLFTEIDMHFLDDYVVLAHDLRNKSDLIGRSKFNMHPRRPVIVRACATWCVHAHAVVWHTETLEECIYLWAWLIVRFYDGRDERGASLLQILNRIGLQFL